MLWWWALSTDQCFCLDLQDSGVPDYEKQARLSRFQGSQSISSSDYFGREDGSGRGSGGGGGGSNADFDVTAGELMSKLSVQVSFSNPQTMRPSEFQHSLCCIISGHMPLLA